MSEFARLDATGQAELVRDGQVSATELVEGAVQRMEALNPQLNAVITDLSDKALAAAGGELPAGPFRGVPMLLKDLACHSAGDPFHEGMAFLKRLAWSEAEDTHLARKFREAGFVFVGKSNTPELGILPTTEPAAYGPTHNPWDLARSPGGSSGGSAAAVAAGIVPVAHANDGGGSIRVPASHCGLVGLKPSRASSPSTWCAARCATARRCSTRCAARCPATRTWRRRDSARTSRRSAPTRVACAWG